MEETDEALEAQQTAIVRLMEKGRTAEEVKQVFRTTGEAVAEAFFRTAGVVLERKHICQVVAMLLNEGWSIRRMMEQFGSGYEREFLECASKLEQWQALGEYEGALKDDDNE